MQINIFIFFIFYLILEEHTNTKKKYFKVSNYFKTKLLLCKYSVRNDYGVQKRKQMDNV